MILGRSDSGADAPSLIPNDMNEIHMFQWRWRGAVVVDVVVAKLDTSVSSLVPSVTMATYPWKLTCVLQPRRKWTHVHVDSPVL